MLNTFFSLLLGAVIIGVLCIVVLPIFGVLLVMAFGTRLEDDDTPTAEETEDAEGE